MSLGARISRLERAEPVNVGDTTTIENVEGFVAALQRFDAWLLTINLTAVEALAAGVEEPAGLHGWLADAVAADQEADEWERSHGLRTTTSE